jgi:NDP-sugar pyrophosphorylase family protein
VLCGGYECTLFTCVISITSQFNGRGTMQAMILAAGLGTRLLPHTLIRPKPLFPILNQPLLLLTIKRLQTLGFDKIVVNCHHLREKIVAALDGIQGVIVQEEEIILGTGGGLRKALKYLRDEPLLVCNGDIYHTVNLLDLYYHHVENKNLVTLAMHNYPRFNNVKVKDGKVASFDNRGEYTQNAFTGLHVIEPSVIQDIGSKKFSCIIDHYRKILKEGGKIDCYRADDCFWTDMGTSEDYINLHQGLLMDTIPCWQEIGEIRKPYYIDKRAKLPAHIELKEWACIGEAHIENGTHLERVVIWDDVSITSGSRLVDRIISADH